MFLFDAKIKAFSKALWCARQKDMQADSGGGLVFSNYQHSCWILFPRQNFYVEKIITLQRVSALNLVAFQSSSNKLWLKYSLTKMGIKQTTPKPTNCRWSNSKDNAFKRFHFELCSGSHASFPSDILIIKTSIDVISTATTNIPRIFWAKFIQTSCLNHCFGSLFFHDFQLCTEKELWMAWDWAFPSSIWKAVLGSHILTIRNEIKLLLQLPTPGHRSFHPSPSSCPSCSRLTLSLTLGWHYTGFVFASLTFWKVEGLPLCLKTSKSSLRAKVRHKSKAWTRSCCEASSSLHKSAAAAVIHNHANKQLLTH